MCASLQSPIKLAEAERQSEQKFVKHLPAHFVETNLIVYDFDTLISLAEEIKRMLISSLNTAKNNNK